MLWEVKGADRKTGVSVHTSIEAATEAEAVKIAGTSMFIESARPRRVKATVVETPAAPPGAGGSAGVLQYRTPGQAAEVVEPMPVEPLAGVPAMPGEKVFYVGAESQVMVSNARLVAMGKTIAMRNVTSVDSAVIPPDRMGYYLLIVILAAVALGSLGAGLGEIGSRLGRRVAPDRGARRPMRDRHLGDGPSDEAASRQIRSRAGMQLRTPAAVLVVQPGAGRSGCASREHGDGVGGEVNMALPAEKLAGNRNENSA